MDEGNAENWGDPCGWKKEGAQFKSKLAWVTSSPTPLTLWDD